MTSPWRCWLVLLATISLPLPIAAARAAGHPEILTPPPAPEPRINGAKVSGVRPGHPLLYTIAATGRRPMNFSVTGLPGGLRGDEGTGRITGAVAQRGTYRVTLRAENALGSAERELRIVVGDELLLTPLLGCNTWGSWGPRVTDANLRAAAKAMVDSGLIQHGWQYVNIDDGWQGQRGGPHRAIQPNEKFGDMRGLCEYIHSLGLKAGIYSTPWTTSYAGFVGGSSDDPQGAWQRPKTPRDGWHFGKHFFEANDSRQWAEWGFDYAKYDWGVDKVEVTKRMVDALAACDRDIVLELSNSVPLAQAAEHTRLAQLSRTTGDLVDLWDRSQMDAGLRRWAVGIREVWLAHDAWAPHQRPGHWNHACNLRIGLLGGWRDQPLTPSRLTPDEQYSHISLWCLWGSPMIIGTPIERLDPFTLSLLSNDEVLEINQDPLGKQARPVKAAGGEALVKQLEDGSKAVGLFNPGSELAEVSTDWSTLGLKGRQQVRDLWRQKDLGVHTEGFTAEVRPHGVVLVRLVPTAKRRPEVVVVYYPHWHSYDHGSAWKGEGWTEWEGVKAAVPRFPGHEQPLRPTWGYFDESDPKWSAREIDLAADHGIDVFLFDWYWYSGVKNMEEALERGFLKAANRQRMKFALMWANHHRRDQFCPDLTKERTVWLSGFSRYTCLRRCTAAEAIMACECTGVAMMTASIWRSISSNSLR